MKTLRLVLCVAAAVVLSACTTDKQLARTAPNSASSHSIVTDSLYVARVEAIARRRGIGITWINPPSKRLLPSPE